MILFIYIVNKVIVKYTEIHECFNIVDVNMCLEIYIYLCIYVVHLGMRNVLILFLDTD